VLPREDRDFDEVRGKLERDLGERVSETRMRELYEKMLKEATIDVRDPSVREAFEQRRPRPK